MASGDDYRNLREKQLPYSLSPFNRKYIMTFDKDKTTFPHDKEYLHTD